MYEIVINNVHGKKKKEKANKREKKEQQKKNQFSLIKNGANNSEDMVFFHIYFVFVISIFTPSVISEICCCKSMIDCFNFVEN